MGRLPRASPHRHVRRGGVLGACLLAEPIRIARRSRRCAVDRGGVLPQPRSAARLPGSSRSRCRSRIEHRRLARVRDFDPVSNAELCSPARWPEPHLGEPPDRASASTASLRDQCHRIEFIVSRSFEATRGPPTLRVGLRRGTCRSGRRACPTTGAPTARSPTPTPRGPRRGGLTPSRRSAPACDDSLRRSPTPPAAPRNPGRARLRRVPAAAPDASVRRAAQLLPRQRHVRLPGLRHHARRVPLCAARRS